MKTVLRYDAPIVEGNFELEVPDNSKVISFGNRFGATYVYILAASNRPMRKKKFIIVGNGGEARIDDLSMHYVGTTRVGETDLHLFEA